MHSKVVWDSKCNGHVLKIHIDGHSDAAMPRYVKQFPMFRWPKTTDEMHRLMQGNDDFIQVNNNK